MHGSLYRFLHRLQVDGAHAGELTLAQAHDPAPGARLEAQDRAQQPVELRREAQASPICPIVVDGQAALPVHLSP